MASASVATDPRAREDRAILRALRIIERRARQPDGAVCDHATASRMFRLSLSGELRECFEAAFLDGRHRLIARERLFSGSVSTAEVHPRVVAQRALALNAAAVIVAHNHPSGEILPSGSDVELTKFLGDALSLVGVRLVDHLIVGGGAPFSFAQAAMLPGNEGRFL